MLLGWDPETSLGMPVRRFFSVLKSARAIESENLKYQSANQRIALLELVDIASCAQGTTKFINQVKSAKIKRVQELLPEFMKPQPMSNKIAFAQFDHYQRMAKRGR